MTHYLDTLRGNASKRHDFCNSLGRQAEWMRKKQIELETQEGFAINGDRAPISEAIRNLTEAMQSVKKAEEAIASIR